MISFDEVQIMLDEIAAKLPDDLYRELNGGIVLNPGEKIHPESLDPTTLYIMGEYCNDPKGLGRYIIIYYGSFIKVHGTAGENHQKKILDKILRHEFLHHLESLGGEKSLEVWDAGEIAKYKKRVLGRRPDIK